VVEEYSGRGYGDLKKGLVEVVEESLAPVRNRTEELLADPAELDRLLAKAADRANEVANRTLTAVYDAIGLMR
jgi:tryptophanyl-tRNA synthetase